MAAWPVRSLKGPTDGHGIYWTRRPLDVPLQSYDSMVFDNRESQALLTLDWGPQSPTGGNSTRLPRS